MLGAGSWGTALAVHLARVGHDVRLWARDRALVDDMRGAPRQRRLSARRRAARQRVGHRTRSTTRCAARELVVSAMPSHGCRAVMRARRAARSRAGATIVSATKGLEAGTLLRMSEVIAQEAGAGHPVVVLSGPSFAIEVARQLPTAVLAASHDARGDRARAGTSSAARTSGSTAATTWSASRSAAALKNIIAIAAGVVEGLGLGHNALAALITRGLAEITRLACAAGGRRETLAGSERPRRSRADLHRRPEPQPPRRHRAGARPLSCRRSSPA